MLRSLKELFGYQLLAEDGDIGKVGDFLFDDEEWVIRYLVVDTGPWILGKRLLISTSALRQPDWSSRSFPVALTRKQVKNSPDIDTDRPVSRQQELELHLHYRWPLYWHHLDPMTAPPMTPRVEPNLIAPIEEQELIAKAKEDQDPNLRSSKEVIGYHIQVRDGEIGHLDDFILDDQRWIIRYLVVDTGNWLPDKKVLIAPLWIKWISHADARVYVDLKKQAIEFSPNFDPSKPVNREYEEVLYDFYGRPRYWKK